MCDLTQEVPHQLWFGCSHLQLEGKAIRLNVVGRGRWARWLGTPGAWDAGGPALPAGPGHSFLSLRWGRTRTFPGGGRSGPGTVSPAHSLARTELSAREPGQCS